MRNHGDILVVNLAAVSDDESDRHDRLGMLQVTQAHRAPCTRQPFRELHIYEI